MTSDNYPKLHRAMWEGLVGKGSPEAEPFIDFDTMWDLTAKAEADGFKVDGTDLFLSDPDTSIDSSDDETKRLADKVSAKNLAVDSVVAAVWGGTGGGSAMGSEEERAKFIQQVDETCRIASKLTKLGRSEECPFPVI